MSSNPKRFRSKGGKIVLDEFAHHNNAEELWSAASPCTTWGASTRILSTHNGQRSLFYRFIDEIRSKKLDWSLHTTSIRLAVEEGLVDKILDRQATEEEKQKWLEERQKNCFNKFTWLQEFCCEAIDETTAFLPYDLIVSCELDNLIKELDSLTGNIFVGMDIARVNDLTVIWVLEKLGNVNYTRMVRTLHDTKFQNQEEVLSSILKHRNFIRCCMDSTGMGKPIAESVESQFGKYRIEGIDFTNKVKEELAYGLRTHFENKTVYIPTEHEIREDLHSIRRIPLTSGRVRFDAEKSKVTGHADRFWALALALHAAKDSCEPFDIESGMSYEAEDLTKGLYDGIDLDTFM